MKSSFHLPGVSFLVMLFFLSASPDTLVIHGIVTKEHSDTVIRNALVIVAMSQANGTLVQDSARSDALGQYEIATISVSYRITISISAIGFQPAENIIEIPAPINGASDSVTANFALRPAVATTDEDTLYIRGIVADAVSRHALSQALVIAHGSSGVGGEMVNDTVQSDAAGVFSMRLLLINKYDQSITVEKNGYRPSERLLPTGGRNVQLDTIFLVALKAGDSVAYTVSGEVSDRFDAGIPGAIVTISLIQNGTVIFSGKDTTSQWGGYYSISTKQPYLTNDMTARVRVVLDGYFPADTSETIPSSTQDIEIYLLLEKRNSSVLPVARALTKNTRGRALLFTADGRRLQPFSQRPASGFVIERVTMPDGTSSQKIIRMK